MLHRLQTLPLHIGKLQQLKELHVRNNRLRCLPASIEHLQLYTFTGIIIITTLELSYTGLPPQYEE